MNAENEERLAIAIRTATRYRLSAFQDLLRAHQDHETFRIQDWVMTRELGFVCSCEGSEQEYRITIRSLQEVLPEARAGVMRLYQHLKRRGSKAEKRRKRRADARAKALLCRHLADKQRRTLRGADFFDVTGSDGRRYRITKALSHNVVLLRGGIDEVASHTPLEPGDVTFCVINDYEPLGGWLPVYDLMLAQKLLLEVNAPEFLDTAVVRRIQEPLSPLELGQEVLDNPEPWVRTQLAGVQGDL